jgi:signal transduction histidine kinase
MLRGDPLRLEQALGNLVENALRYGSGTIRLIAAEQDTALEIHVTDERDGLPAAFAPRAFERFSRADEARSSSGAGLGLAIVRAIADAHGATVAATNLPEGGADICLRFPIDDPGAPG